MSNFLRSMLRRELKARGHLPGGRQFGRRPKFREWWMILKEKGIVEWVGGELPGGKYAQLVYWRWTNPTKWFRWVREAPIDRPLRERRKWIDRIIGRVTRGKPY